MKHEAAVPLLTTRESDCMEFHVKMTSGTETAFVYTDPFPVDTTHLFVLFYFPCTSEIREVHSVLTNFRLNMNQSKYQTPRSNSFLFVCKSGVELPLS